MLSRQRRRAAESACRLCEGGSRFSKHLAARTETVERTVLFSRAFRPLLDTVAMEHYTAQLQLIARHAQEGSSVASSRTSPRMELLR